MMPMMKRGSPLRRGMVLAALVGVVVAILTPAPVQAAGSGFPNQRAPVNLRDAVSLQRGAQLFVNYCLGCHSANYMRFNRLTEIGLTEEQIKEYLLFTTDKIGATMTIAMRAGDAKEWMGKAPPDMTVLARAKRPDYIYTLLKTYYVDESRGLGWNNLAYPNIGMPHPLWQLQGNMQLKVDEKESHGHTVQVKSVVAGDMPGAMTAIEYDRAVGDLVNFLVYMGEPWKVQSTRIGIIVLFFLGIMLILVYLLKLEFWRDIKH
jgi:ubiquinol-cytochrome c reductase cytochrome c1 subunit